MFLTYTLFLQPFLELTLAKHWRVFFTTHYNTDGFRKKLILTKARRTKNGSHQLCIYYKRDCKILPGQKCFQAHTHITDTHLYIQTHLGPCAKKIFKDVLEVSQHSARYIDDYIESCKIKSYEPVLVWTLQPLFCSATYQRHFEM